MERSIPSCSDFISTWLYPKIFHHWSKNLDNPVSKHSELLASHRGSLRSEEHLYSYPIRATIDSRVLRSWSCLVKYTPILHPYAISVSPHTLVKRTIQLIWHTMTYTRYNYHFCNNYIIWSRARFKNYTMNIPLSF